MIVLDEQLQGLGLEEAVARWYRELCSSSQDRRLPRQLPAWGKRNMTHTCRLYCH
jgi:hypothetical protein